MTVKRYTAGCTSSLSTIAQLDDVQGFAVSVEVGRSAFLRSWISFNDGSQLMHEFRGNTRQLLSKPSRVSELE